MRFRAVLCASVIVGMVCALGCGGSGSSSGSSDSGDISLSVEPNIIAVSSLAFVTLDFSDIAFDDLNAVGVTFKFLLPPSVEFVLGSSALVLSQGASDLQPLYSGAATSQSSSGSAVGTYVIFPVTASQLKKETSGKIQFNVRAVQAVSEAKLEADLDRTALTTFDPTAASFTAEAKATIKVVAATTTS